MKRLLCAAAAVACVLAVARADEGAYRSLVGMASVASSSSAAGHADAPADDGVLSEALRDAVAEAPAPRTVAARRVPASAPAAAPVPATAAAPKPWTRLYSTLSAPWRSAPELKGRYEAPASTAAAAVTRPVPALVPPPDSEAVKAGERRGLAELLSTSVAP